MSNSTYSRSSSPLIYTHKVLVTPAKKQRDGVLQVAREAAFSPPLGEKNRGQLTGKAQQAKTPPYKGGGLFSFELPTHEEGAQYLNPKQDYHEEVCSLNPTQLVSAASPETKCFSRRIIVYNR